MATIKVSKKGQLLKPSPTLAMAGRARELQAQGKDVISMTVGEPDWASFQVANEAGIAAIQQGFTKYTPAHGTVELRQAIANLTTEQLGVKYGPNDVVVGNGAKYILFSAFMMLLDEGDEVLIPAPYWVSYPTMVELAGGTPRFIDCDESVHFKLTAELLQKNISAKTKALILCSPSNPTGLQYSADELASLARVLADHPQIMVISDDIYNRLIFDDKGVSPHLLHARPEFRDRLLVVNGVSKTYSMTGWRVGWALGPQFLMQPMADFLSQTTSNLSSISQKAALAAIQKGEPELQIAKQNLQRKMQLANQQFGQLKKIRVVPADGAFYVWLDIRGCFGLMHKGTGAQIKNSKDFAEVLLNEHLVASVPGSEFGTEGYLRLSIATSEANIQKAAVRFQDLEAALSH